MNKRKFIQRVIKHLRGLADGTVQPASTAGGLCWELQIANLWCSKEPGAFTTVFTEWPKGNGSHILPISTAGKIGGASDWINNPNRWWADEYGDLRRELCDWTADWMEENIEELIGPGVWSV